MTARHGNPLPLIREAVSSRHPDAALLALGHLGWGRGDAQTSPCPGVPAFERLFLGSWPTRAAVAREQRESPRALDDAAYFAGHRWSLSVHDGALRWHDFSAGQVWHCEAANLSTEALHGFTPASFAHVGRFEPHGATLTDAVRREDASEYLQGQIHSWSRRWLGDLAPSANVEVELDHFVQILSALLLVKTIEGLDRLPWLRRGALITASRDGASLTRLLRRCAKALNSRVLRAIVELPDDHQLVRPLLTSIEESEIDFASLDVDPVGAFYERMLGTAYDVTDPRQMTLPTMGAGRDVSSDLSARRRLGAFFTPRSYADTLAHQLILPAVRVAESADKLPSVLDPAAGSGELLCAALREMLAEEPWRRPYVARTVLADKLWAIDLNRHAVQLAALNVLRTAVRLVPEMLDGDVPFPALDRNFIVGDAKTRSVLDRVPTVDAVLLNPPFRGHRQWQPPATDRAAAIEALPGPVNLAFAFLSIALDKVRDGGAVGAVMASQLFSGVQHRAVREQIASTLRIETVVVNHGSPFPDALSYAGLLMGHRLPGCQLPRAEVITVPGGTRGGASDLGAALFMARAPEEHGVEARPSTRWVSLARHALADWTGQSPTAHRAGATTRRVALKEALVGGLHQGIVAAPELWGYELFVFKDVPGGVVPKLGGKRLDDRTPTLRPFARPRLMKDRVPNFCEPEVHGERVFLPGRGDADGVPLDRLQAADPTGAELARSISKRVKATTSLSGRALTFAESVRRGKISFNWHKGYVDSTAPMIVLSTATRSPVGRSSGVLLSVWVNLDGSVVPLEGAHARTASPEHAILVATLLNVGDAIDPLLADAPARNQGTKKPNLSVLLNQWMIPDITVGVYQGIVGELVDAFHLYRAAVREKTPAEAHTSPEYRDVIGLGQRLWHL